MHAALVSVRVAPETQGTALAMLREQVVPMFASAPGFVAGHWLLRGDLSLPLPGPCSPTVGDRSAFPNDIVFDVFVDDTGFPLQRPILRWKGY